MDDMIFQSIDKNTVVLTANRRLSSYLQQRYAYYQQTLENTAWETPTILPLMIWINSVWNKLEKNQRVLSNAQECTLWKKISQQNWASIPIIQAAWNNIKAWDIGLELLQTNTNDATQKFYQWAAHFSETCQKNQWITSADLPQQLLTSNKINEFLPKKILLVGFDDFSPTVARLLDHIQKICTVEIIPENEVTSNITRYELDNKESEIQHMAEWAYQEYNQHPDKKIGCIIPNLASIRHPVVRIFSDRFPEKSVFNISSGQALNELLLVQTALQVIRLAAGTLKDGEWASLLQSPYLAIQEEDITLGALVDKMRRSKNLSHIEAHTLLPFFTTLHPRFPKSTYLKRWNQLVSLQKKIPSSQTLTQWIGFFITLLKTLGWPGSRTLNSHEHQILSRWLKALEELTQCDAILGPIPFENAFALLENHLSHIIFQPKTQEAPVQVLGVLETAGLHFDALWLLGLDDESWPPSPSPNPFLPYSLQMKHNMPHATAERELIFTQQTMKRLFSSANEIYLSSAKREGDRQLAPSHLITAHPKNSSPFVSATSALNANNRIEHITNSQGPAITENETINGGTFVLKYQAICPFNAYATIRLSAEPLENPMIGLSPRIRGQLLHQCLERLWKQLKDQKNLLALNDETLTNLLSNTIDQVIVNYSDTKYDQAFLSIEKKRLIPVLKDWLNIEKERAPFSVIACEATRQTTIGKLGFHCRIDRIDQLHNGTQLIIDYKTGLCNSNDWFGDRPQEPQLPIYCVFGNGTPSEGLAFAQVRAGKMQFKGVISEQSLGDSESGFVKINAYENTDNIYDWNALTKHWKTTLTTLSYHFYQGHAEVDPLETACTFCQLQPLCRVNACQNP